MSNKHNRTNRGGKGSSSNDLAELEILIRAKDSKPSQRFGKQEPTPARKPNADHKVELLGPVVTNIIADKAAPVSSEEKIAIPIMDDAIAAATGVRHNPVEPVAAPVAPAAQHMVVYWQLLNDTEAFLGHSL